MRLTFVWPAIFAAVPLFAGGSWKTIPAEVWAMKEDPGKGFQGAVVLEERIKFSNTLTEYVYRVRIFSEAGRKAAELSEFPPETYDFDGRTVYPDGKQVTFNQRKDFTSLSVKSGSGYEVKRNVVIPPGVNANCVVELRWKESGTPNFGPLSPTRRYMGEWTLGNQYRTLKTVVEIPSTYPSQWQWRMFVGANSQPKSTVEGVTTIFTFPELPAVEALPFALPVTQEHPRMAIFYQPKYVGIFVGKPSEEFWKAVSEIYFKRSYLDDVKLGKAFKTFSAEIMKGIPNDGSPHSKATLLFEELQGRIRNTDTLTFAEKANQMKEQDKKEDEPLDLDVLVNKGEGDSEGMKICYFHLLRAAGLKPKMALVANRNLRLFDFSFHNIFQFTNELLGVDEPGKGTIWFDPSMRFGTPGVVHPVYQGTPALQLDTDTWAVSRINMPVQAAGLNQRRFEYQIQSSEQEDAFKLKASFTGFPEHDERLKYLSSSPVEQQRKLKEELEELISGVIIQKTELHNVLSPKDPISLEAEGRVEQEGGRRRTVQPFPGMSVPIYIPDTFPESRKDSIVLPYLRTHIAISHILVPKAYHFGNVDPLIQSNNFGKVQWAVSSLPKGDDSEVTVTLRVDVTGFSTGPGGYANLKAFLGWVSEASRRTIVLEKTQ